MLSLNVQLLELQQQLLSTPRKYRDSLERQIDESPEICKPWQTERHLLLVVDRTTEVGSTRAGPATIE